MLSIPSPGSWSAVIKLAVLLCCAVLAGCTASAHSPGPLPPPKVTVAAPLKQRVQDFDTYTGRLDAEQTVEVRARVSGYLQEIHFKDGDIVEAGQPLFTIDKSTYDAAYRQALAQIELWKAKYEFAEATRARSEKLAQSGAVAIEEYQRQVADAKQAKASQVAAEADAEARKIDLEFTNVTSPIKGRIDRTFVTIGNLVQAGPGEPTLLTRIVSVDPIYVYFDVDERALLEYTENRLATEQGRVPTPVRDKKIPVEITMTDGAVYGAPGVVDFASNRVDPGTGTITIRATLPNADAALVPGLFVRVRISANKGPYDAILISERAIGTDQSEKYVYVIEEDGKARRQGVVLGTKHGQLRVIKDGLEGDERVVVNGLLNVRPGQPVSAEDGPMPGAASLDEAAAETSPGDLSPGVETTPTPPAGKTQPPAGNTPPHTVRRPIER